MSYSISSYRNKHIKKKKLSCLLIKSMYTYTYIIILIIKCETVMMITSRSYQLVFRY